MRKRLYEIVEHAKDGDKVSAVYDAVMLVAIMLSLIPLMFAQDYPIFNIIEMVTVALFILDYILRWITADFRLKKGGWSFLLYPRGLEWVEEPKVLRFFFGRLKEIGYWQEDLAKKFRADFGDSL